MPERLPGPRPVSSTTLDRYLQLMKRCMDINPATRPSFVEITTTLREMATTEGVDPAEYPTPHTTVVGTSSRNPSTGLMECGICYAPMGGGAAKSMATIPCGHIFCFDDLVRPDVRNCPLCRRPYTRGQILKLHD